MLISNFDDNSKIFKCLKSPLVTSSILNPFLLIGAYDGFNVIRVMNVEGYSIDPTIMNILLSGGWINFGITSKLDMDGEIPQELIPMINGPVMRNDKGDQLYFIDVNRELNIKLDSIMQIIDGYEHRYSNLIFNDGDFFADFDQKKATDGASFLKIDPHIILTVFKGLIPYAKGDIVTYDIYCGQRDFLAAFKTKKKKKEPDITTFIRYLYL